MKIGTMCSGIGGVDVGAEMAGIKSAWRIEIDPRRAAIADRNLRGKTIVADITKIFRYFKRLSKVDIFHLSPPCPSFSSAKAKKDRGETKKDLAIAHAAARAIKDVDAPIVTFENVYGYRKSQSWQIIESMLVEYGYFYTVDHVNAADYGVPQTRMRMIVRAMKGSLIPPLPTPEPWIGWYESIEDLIPDLPESQFANWQMNILPDEIKTILMGNDRKGDNRDVINHRCASKPSITVTEQSGPKIRAFIMDGRDARNTRPFRMGSDPSFTIIESSHKGMNRAWIESGKVVRMTPRCLARFQSFPDSFQIDGTLGIGNAVPPLMYKKIIEGLIQ